MSPAPRSGTSGPSASAGDTGVSRFRHGRVLRRVRERQLVALAEDLFAERASRPL